MSSSPWSSLALLGASILLAACADGPTPTSPLRPHAVAAGQQIPTGIDPAVVLAVRQLAAQRGIIPLAHPAPVRPPRTAASG